jgi:hypothetical protein
VSAQIIAALRKRASKLDDGAADLDMMPSSGSVEDDAAREVAAAERRWLAEEFRALADEAEKHG